MKALLTAILLAVSMHASADRATFCMTLGLYADGVMGQHQDSTSSLAEVINEAVMKNTSNPAKGKAQISVARAAFGWPIESTESGKMSARIKYSLQVEKICNEEG